MYSNINSNVRTLSISESNFFTKMRAANILVVDLIDLYNKGKTEEVMYRNDDYDFAITALNCSRKNNLAVTGNSGVGKTAFIHFLAKFIALVLPEYNFAEINIASLISGCAYRGEFEKKLTTVIELATLHNIIVYFDEAHCLSMTGGNNTGGIDAVNILKPYLTRNFRCIISTTTDEAFILEKDIAFSRRFRFLELTPLSSELKRKIIISKFGESEVTIEYLRSFPEKSKELFEMIDDLDFLLSKKLIKGSNYEIHFK